MIQSRPPFSGYKGRSLEEREAKCDISLKQLRRTAEIVLSILLPLGILTGHGLLLGGGSWSTLRRWV